jgi:hypothetical protein
MMRSSLLRTSATLTALAAFATAATLSSGACIRTESYVYSAQKYDPTAACVAAYAPVELVNGPGAGSRCPATCLTVDGELYVSTMCPPLPSIASDVAADSTECKAALAAAATGGTCEAPADGGKSGDGGDSSAPQGDADIPETSAADAMDSSIAPPKDASEAG